MVGSFRLLICHCADDGAEVNMNGGAQITVNDADECWHKRRYTDSLVANTPCMLQANAGLAKASSVPNPTEVPAPAVLHS